MNILHAHADAQQKNSRARQIVRALGGEWLGDYGMARCPAHADRTPSLSVTEKDRKVLVYCHAGCSQGAVISALRQRDLWPTSRASGKVISGQNQFKKRTRYAQDQLKTKADALGIWNESPQSHDLLETYLRVRGITITPPPVLRFHPSLYHSKDEFWPAIVALVTHGVTGEPLGIHRTFLSRNGTDKAPVRPQKKLLGPSHGGAIRLTAPAASLMVGEGIETCLSALQATGRAVWSALSTSGLRSLPLPDEVTEVIILADGDDRGEAAARNAANRWRREGRHVRIARAPPGLDFNNVLLGHTHS